MQRKYENNFSNFFYAQTPSDFVNKNIFLFNKQGVYIKQEFRDFSEETAIYLSSFNCLSTSDFSSFLSGK